MKGRLKMIGVKISMIKPYNPKYFFYYDIRIIGGWNADLLMNSKARQPAIINAYDSRLSQVIISQGISFQNVLNQKIGAYFNACYNKRI